MTSLSFPVPVHNPFAARFPAGNEKGLRRKNTVFPSQAETVYGKKTGKTRRKTDFDLFA
jgi:hypothetical protein